jgi:hypothetical protein
MPALDGPVTTGRTKRDPWHRRELAALAGCSAAELPEPCTMEWVSSFPSPRHLAEATREHLETSRKLAAQVGNGRIGVGPMAHLVSLFHSRAFIAATRAEGCGPSVVASLERLEKQIASGMRRVRSMVSRETRAASRAP